MKIRLLNKNLYLKFLSLLMLFAMYSCTPRGATVYRYDYDQDYVVEKVERVTPELCSYSGKVIFTFKNDDEKVKASALSKKDCNNNLSVRVLGPFGAMLASIEITDGFLTIKKSGDDLDYSQDYATVGELLELVMPYLSTPYVLPDDSFYFITDGSGYRFIRDDLTIYVNHDFYISGYDENGARIRYIWEGGELVSLRFEKIRSALVMEFGSKWVKE